MDILGVSECRWIGSGKQVANDGTTILYSGNDKLHIRGVALIITREKAKTLMEWEPMGDRMLRARFNSRYCKLTLVLCYAPTNDADEELKDDWYEQLQRAVSQVPKHDLLMIIGDLNAKVGSQNTNWERSMGKHGCGTMNDNGERLVDFCLDNNFVIGGTIFPHKEIHKLTWISPDGRTANQIDHIMINSKWRRSLLDVKVRRGADVGSDHHLLTAKIKLKLRKIPTEVKGRKHLNIGELKRAEKKNDFILEIRNRFDALLEVSNDEVERSWANIKAVYNEAAEKTLGFKKKSDKKWLTPKTWDEIETRRKLKEKLLSAKTRSTKEQAIQTYRDQNRKVKRSARADKRAYIEELATQAEQAARRGDSSTVYKITKQLCGCNTRQAPPVKDEDGNIIASEKAQAERWVDHFRDVLNRPQPESPANPPPADEDLNIEVNTPNEEEVRTAIQALKCGKAPGIDAIHAELLKADIETSTKVLTNLFKNIWEKDTIPGDWSKGLIVRIPKKGDLSRCDNWRGITLLSTPSKVFCSILLKRIENELDNKLREEQAGFRKGRGCTDQIFALRNIIEQCLEWNTPLFINFVDFRKAFDSVYRDSLWKILRHYGIPQKIVTIISKFYDHFECNVILNGTFSDSFLVKSGVRQGCILSPILFLVTIDWIMRSTISDQPRGIKWTQVSQLEDLDFADDLALLSSRQQDLQVKTDRLRSFAQSTGLHISATKSNVMCINTTGRTQIKIQSQPLEEVTDFTYLGSVMSNEDSIVKDIRSRLAKARNAFCNLNMIWKSKQYSLKTKVKIYNSNVKSVLLYGSECWCVVKRVINKVAAFHNSCLRKLCQIFWPQIISNKELYKKTGCHNIIEEIKRRRYRWLGHTMRMDENRIPKVALHWLPTGKRNRGRPRTTWRRTIEADLKEMGSTWREMETLAEDRQRWRSFTAALCPTGDEED